MFSFEYPWVAVALIVFVACDIYCKAKVESLFFPHLSSLLLKEKKQIAWLDMLKWLGIVSAIIALMSPVMIDRYDANKKDARDIVLILDSSESMSEPLYSSSFGVLQSKFDAAKEIMKSFVRSRVDDRIGMVTFGNAAFYSSPLTFDTNLLLQILDMQQIGIAGQRTAINDALLQSYSMLSRSNAKSKIVILLTDGAENQSVTDPQRLLSLIQKSNNTLYTIGLGDAGDYDPAYLTTIAKAGHGEFFEASDKETLQKIYNYINQKVTSKVKAKPKAHKEPLFLYPLFVAWLSLVLWIYFRNIRRGM